MSSETGGGLSRPGFRLLTTGLLLAAALGAIAVLDRQIEVFGFGDSGPDARSFPRLAFWLLAAVLALRLVLTLRAGDSPLGRPVRLGRVAAVAVFVAASLWVMPVTGFFVAAAGTGVAVALVLGERRPLPLIVPVLAAALVAYGGRHGLNIPLP
ncbi:tripartite tricarboxylate transporter TctB family protein [Sagittula sp. S175]|uniref:tripartite tricarboxylate transporter TctB family protein n=1 Tax=Sagittula sp. S175 TaxID=3415129 RepID=UPI003C7D157A